MDYYPSWLAAELLGHSFEAEKAAATTIPEFFAEYTLHDSIWIGFQLDPIYDGAGLAILRWDTHWTDGRILFPGSAVAEWPILLIRFARVHRAVQRGYEIEAPAPTRGIDAATTRVALAPSPDGAHTTTFEDHYGGVFEVDHAPPVQLICFSREHSILPIPGFSAV